MVTWVYTFLEIHLIINLKCIVLHANYASVNLKKKKHKLSAAPHAHPSISDVCGSAHVLVPVWNILLSHFHNSMSNYPVNLNEIPVNCAFKIRYVRTFPSTPKFLLCLLATRSSTPPAQEATGRSVFSFKICFAYKWNHSYIYINIYTQVCDVRHITYLSLCFSF